MKKWCITVAVLLTVIMAVYFISDFYLTPEQLYRDYADTGGGSNYSREDFYTEYLDMVDDNRGSPGDGTPSSSIVNSFVGGGSTDSWYSDIAEGTKAGNRTDEVFIKSTNSSDPDKFPDIHIYDGLPWDADGNTYFWNIRKARDDIWELYGAAGIEKNTAKGATSKFMTSTVTHAKAPKEVTYDGQYAALVDGVYAVGVGVYPAMWKKYYPDLARQVTHLDSSGDLWKYKIAIVVVDSGADMDVQGNWKYVPATRLSAKVHTFYGGVQQTNVKMEGGYAVAASTSSGWTGNYQTVRPADYGDDRESVIRMIRDTQAYAARNWGDWWGNWGETYNISKDNMNRIELNYDIVGYIIYGDTFTNMD